MRKIYSKLRQAMVIAVACLVFASCSSNNDEPEDATWSTVCEVKFEISQDLLDVLDITAHNANPDGTIREEPVSKTNTKWTLKGEQIPNNAGVYITFAPKSNFVETDKYDIKILTAYTTFSYKNNELVDSRTYSRDCDCTMTGKMVKDSLVEKGVGIASGIDSHGSVIDVDTSEIDFGLNIWIGDVDFWGMHYELIYDEGGKKDDIPQDDVPQEGAWSSCYDVKFEIGYDMFEALDITAHIANPDGTYREETLVYDEDLPTSVNWEDQYNDAVVSWSLNSDFEEYSNYAAVVLTFVPKQNISYPSFRIKATMTGSLYRDGKHITSYTYDEGKWVGYMMPDELEIWATHGLGVALEVCRGEYVDEISDENIFDFDINPGWSDWRWLWDFVYGHK